MAGKARQCKNDNEPKITRVPLMVIGARVTNSSNLESLLIQTPVAAAAILAQPSRLIGFGISPFAVASR